MPKADPQRTCLGCRETMPKKALLRFVLDPGGGLVPDILQKLPGRGAYTCFSPQCLDAALKKKQFSRALKEEMRPLAAPVLKGLVVKLLEERIVSLLAIANKAGMVVSGSDTVMDALRGREAGLLVTAEDISPDSLARFAAVAGKTGVEVCRFSVKRELGQPLGKELRTAVAVKHGPLAAVLKVELSRYWNFYEGGAK